MCLETYIEKTWIDENQTFFTWITDKIFDFLKIIIICEVWQKLKRVFAEKNHILIVEHCNATRK